MTDATRSENKSPVLIADEYEHELISIKYSALTKSVKLLFWENSYVYKKARKKKNEPDMQPPELSIQKKKVKRKIKATKQQLEMLRCCEDELIRVNAEGIVESTGKIKLYPAWYRVLLLERERDTGIAVFESEIARINAMYDEESRPSRDVAREVSSQLLGIYAELSMREQVYEEAKEDLCVFDQKRAKMLGHILWWKYSDKKRQILAERIAECEQGIEQVAAERAELERQLYEHTQRISDCERRRAVDIYSAESRMDAYVANMNETIARITT